MAHDQQPVLIFHQFPEGVGLHAGLHPGGLLHLLGFAAVILNLIRILHHRLVASAAQGHVDGGSGILVVLAVGVAVHTDPDAQGHRHVVADVDGLYVLQNGEPVLLDPGNVLLLDGKEIFVLLHLFHDAVHTGDIFVDLAVDEGGQQGAPHFLHALQRLIVVVQVNEPGHQLLVVDLLHVLEGLSLVQQVHRGHFRIKDGRKRFLALPGPGDADLVQVDAVVPVPVGAVQGHHIASGGQLFPLDLGKQGQKVLGRGFLAAHDAHKFPVHPQQAAVFIRHRVGHQHLVHHLQLHLVVGGGKLHHGRGDAALAGKIDPQRNSNIDYRERGHNDARLDRNQPNEQAHYNE